MFEYLFLFWFGGSIYIEIELLYRNYTHWTMFILAGFVFVTVGLMNEKVFNWYDDIFEQIGVATIWATICELVCGLILRYLGLQVWDYSNVPLNLDGLICIPFIAVWWILMVIAIVVDDLIKFYFFEGLRPHYHCGKMCVKLCPLKIEKENDYG